MPRKEAYNWPPVKQFRDSQSRIAGARQQFGALLSVLRQPHPIQAATGYGSDPAGNDYGQPQLSLEDAIDLAEAEVQGIISLVNVLYTDQVGGVSASNIFL